MVVCPQCLASYPVQESNAITPEQVRQMRQPSMDVHQLEKKYCSHCGNRISAGINFCPYCGVNLRQDVVTNLHQAMPISSDVMMNTPVDDTDETGEQTDEMPKEKGFEWKPMLPSYRISHRHRHHPASAHFQAVAFALIIGLLVTLGYIVYHAMKL